MEYSPNYRVFRGYKLNQKYNEIYQKSIQNREEFWKNISENIFWYKKPTEILNSDSPPFYKWFEDGRLNASYNCIDRHVGSGNGDNVALIFETDDGKIENVTYNTLLVKVCKFANALIKRGYKKGDRAIILSLIHISEPTRPY